MDNTIKRCTKCVLSSSFPKIEFDENGVCNFCRNEMYFMSTEKAITNARKKIQSLFKNKSNKAEYDAIMCYSGGKDSTYTLKLAVEKYNLRVLAFTLDNNFISPQTMENMGIVLGKLGVDLLTMRPSAQNMHAIIKASALHRIYNKKTLTRISSVCNSCISMVNMYALKIALEKHIPFILAGFTLGQIPANSIVYKNNYNFLKETREDSLERLTYYAGDEVKHYLSLNEELILNIDEYPYNINPLCIENISESNIVHEIEKIGWIAPKDVDGCSSNCRLNTFNNHVHQRTFGYSPYELELSHLIRKGQLSREDAIKKINDQPEQELISIKNELKITEPELDKLNELYEKD